MPALSDLYVILSVQTGEFTAGLDKAAATGEDFAAKFTASQEETAAAARDMAAEANAAADEMVAAQAKVAESAAAGGDAEKGLADMERLAAEMAADATVQQKLLNDARLASVDATLSSARAQGILKDAEIASGDAAEATAGKQEASAAKTDAAGASAGAAGGHFKMMGLAALAGAAISVKMAGDFQQSMTRLVTSAGETQSNLKMVSAGILAMSTATNTSTSQLASGMYYVESAGFHGAAGLNVLKAAAQGAQAEGADLSTVANAVTSGLNAYGLGASHATQFTNEMVTAVAHGKMTMQDLADSISTVLPAAAKAGLNFSQVGGAISTMTAQGMSARQATLDLRHTILSLQTPTTVQTGEMQQLGINSNKLAKNLGKEGLTGTISQLEEAVLKGMGPAGMVLLKSFNQSKLAAQSAQQMIASMPPTLQKLARSYQDGEISSKGMRTALYALSGPQANVMKQFETATNSAHGFNTQLKAGGGNAQTFTAALSKMMGGTTGLQTALMVGGAHMATFKANTDAISAAAEHTGKNVNNWALIQKNFNFQLGSAEKAAKVVAISFGQALLPAVTKALHVFTEFGSWLSSHTAASRAFAIVVGVLLAGAFEHALVKGLKLSTSGLEDMWKGARKVLVTFGILQPATDAQAGAQAAEAVTADAAAASTGLLATAAGALQVALDALGIGLIIAAVAGLVVGLIELYKHCKAVRDVVADVGHFFSGLWRDAMKVAGDAIRSFENGPLKTIQSGIAQLSAWWRQHSQEIEAVTRFVWATIGLYVKTALTLIGTYIKIALIPWEIAFRVAFGIIKDTVVTVWHLISNEIKIAVTLIEGIIGVFLDLVTGHWSKAWHDLLDTGKKLLGEIRNLISTFTKDCLRLLYDAGKNLILGLVHGFESMFGDVKSAVTGLGHNVVSWFTGSGVDPGMHNAGAAASANAAAGVAAGAPGAFNAGADVGAAARSGLAAGLAGQAGNPVRGGVGGQGLAAATSGAFQNIGKQAAAAATKGFSSGLDGGGGGGGGGLGGALGGAGSGLGSTSGAKNAISAARQLGLEIAAGLIKSLEGTASQVKAAAAKLTADVKTALTQGTIGNGEASSLTRFIERDNTRLQDLANKRAKILKEIATARKYATTTAQAEESQFGVVNAAGGGTAPATAASILATLKTNLTSIRAFKSNIAKLAKMGLNKAYISQIIAAGPVDGGQIAQELASGSWSQIQQINTVEKQITSASTSLGKTAADAMYDSGKDAGKGFLTGLEHQQKSIEDVMKRIAKAMVNTIKKELRISSPSQVMREHGMAVAQGLALGIDDGIAGAASASKRLAGAVSSGASGGGAHGGGTVIHLEPHVIVQGYIGDQEQLVAKLLPPLQKVVLEVNRINPGTGNGLSLGTAAGRAA